MNYQIIFIPPEKIRDVWSGVSGWLDTVIPHGNGEFTVTDLYERCLQGRMQLWIAVDADYKSQGVAVTEIVDYPRKRAIRIVALGGKDFRRWMDAGDRTMKAWAQQIGASSIEIIGRKGWTRFLRGMYKEAYCFMTREV